MEDKRFYEHRGTDWMGLSRAAVDSLFAGRIVSGGSTLTMQTARMLEPRDRNIGSKLIEIARAWQLERRLTKDEILDAVIDKRLSDRKELLAKWDETADEARKRIECFIRIVIVNQAASRSSTRCA